MQNRKIDMLRAAMPYTEPRYRKPMQVLIQTEELVSYINEDGEADMEACDTGSVGDVEGMMESIKDFCNPKELETVNLVLNFVRAQRMYRTYRSFKQSDQSGSNNGMMEFLASQLTPEQQKTFGKMAAVMNES
ncbi:MAG: hypothetical protein E7265_07485 [Lachnospiraceae bacterium]|nr:hypothetical protein [Lachnospiraceae bacterium]